MNVVIYFLVLISLLVFETNAYQGGFEGNERDSYNRYDPDAILHGFFPLWGIVLVILAGVFLLIVALGLIGYLLGCRTPLKIRQPSTDSTTPFIVIQNFAMTL